MEENIMSPAEINSMDVNMVLQTNSAYLSKKRKFQAEQLGMPCPKHKLSDRSSALVYDSSSSDNLGTEQIYSSMVRGMIDRRTMYDESGSESVAGSNSVSGNSGYLRSFSDEYSTEPRSSNYLSDQPSTSSSVNLTSNQSDSMLYSLDSTSSLKSGSSKLESSYMAEEYHIPHHDLDPSSSLNYEEHLEFSSDQDYSCSCLKDDSIVRAYDKELEDMLYSHGLTPSNYVLSSGRWNLNQDADTKMESKKLTIDKEFEQYFSSLML